MSNQEPDFENMTDAELAEWQYAHKDELDDDLADAEEVEFEVAKPLGTAMSFRLSEDEAAKIRKAAGQLEMSLSEWVRQACVQAADVQESPMKQWGGVDVRDVSPLNVHVSPGFLAPHSQFRGLKELHSTLRAMQEHASAFRKAEEDLEVAAARAEQLIDSWLEEADVHTGSSGQSGR